MSIDKYLSNILNQFGGIVVKNSTDFVWLAAVANCISIPLA